MICRQNKTTTAKRMVYVLVQHMISFFFLICLTALKLDLLNASIEEEMLKLFNLLFLNVRYMSTIYKRVTRAWYINYDLIHLYDKNFFFDLFYAILYSTSLEFNVYHVCT